MFDPTTAILLRDKAARLGDRYRSYTLRSLVIQLYPDGSEIPQLIQVEPKPTIQLQELKPEELAKGASQATKVYEVKGISRKFTRTQLEKEAVEFVIDGKTTDTPLTGIFCHLVQGSVVETDLCWSLKLVERVGENTLYGAF